MWVTIFHYLPEINLMFCVKKYHPFDGSDFAKINMHPHSEVWSLNFTRDMYPAHQQTDIFNGYARSHGHDPR